MNKQAKANGGRGIEWTDYTWNPIAGCIHGCAWTMPDGTVANCYAEDVANKLAQSAYPQGFEHHYWNPGQLSAPLSIKTPSRVFVGSMADVFGHWVPDEQIQQVLDTCAKADWHTFQFLTKNAPRLLKFKFPANCWVGASLPPTHMFGKQLDDKQRKAMFRKTLDVFEAMPTVTRWMSFEPLSWSLQGEFWLRRPPFQWAVIGAATSGAKVFQPEAEWVRRLVNVLDLAGVPVFFKGNLRGNEAVTVWREEFPTGEAARAPEPAPVQGTLF